MVSMDTLRPFGISKAHVRARELQELALDVQHLKQSHLFAG
jgi:hypothetical protein